MRTLKAALTTIAAYGIVGFIFTLAITAALALPIAIIIAAIILAS